jgi:rare lipoprotein A
MKKLLLTCFILCFILQLKSFGQKTDTTYTGIASYYHLKFNGRKTSSGEKFCNDSLTAAHKFLAFGTKVKVTNLNNGNVVIVKINDRLPQRSKRTIDLTQEAAKRLGIIRKGLQKVEIIVISPSQENKNSTLGGEPFQIDNK